MLALTDGEVITEKLNHLTD